MAALNTDDVKINLSDMVGPTVKSIVSSQIATLSWKDISKSKNQTKNNYIYPYPENEK